jgi:hypothetical protein
MKDRICPAELAAVKDQEKLLIASGEKPTREKAHPGSNMN